jgi:hypothetical protein
MPLPILSVTTRAIRMQQTGSQAIVVLMNIHTLCQGYNAGYQAGQGQLQPQQIPSP